MRQREENGPGQPRKNVKNVGQIRPTPNVSGGSVSWHQSTGGIKGSLAGSPNKAWQSQTAFLKGKTPSAFIRRTDQQCAARRQTWNAPLGGPHGGTDRPPKVPSYNLQAHEQVTMTTETNTNVPNNAHGMTLIPVKSQEETSTVAILMDCLPTPSTPADNSYLTAYGFAHATGKQQFTGRVTKLRSDREKEDAELRIALSQMIDVDLNTMPLEHGLGRLDALIQEAFFNMQDLWRRAPGCMMSDETEPFLGPSQSKLTCSNGNCSRVPPTVVHDLKQIVREKRILTSNTQEPKHLYRTPHESPLWHANEMSHAALIPALHAAAHKRARRLCFYLDQQANDYKDAETRWRANLCVREYQRGHTSLCPPRQPEGAKRNERTFRHRGESCSSLFSLDSLRSTASGHTITCVESDEAGSLGAPTRARKALREETSEHERVMSEILASSAKEARFERGSINESDLPLPLPISVVVQEDTRLRESALSCRHISDPLAEEVTSSQSRQWSDLEKCIFVDKFLQYPKSFGKIAAFFMHKRACDCARLYYDTKYAINYKALLREHQQRRRGVRICWDVTAKAVQVFGGELQYDLQRNLVCFRLPADHLSIQPIGKHVIGGRPTPKPQQERTANGRSSWGGLETCTTLEQHASLHALAHKQIAEGNLKTTLMGRCASTHTDDRFEASPSELFSAPRQYCSPMYTPVVFNGKFVETQTTPEALGNCDENKVQPSEAPEECQLVPRSSRVYSRSGIKLIISGDKLLPRPLNTKTNISVVRVARTRRLQSATVVELRPLPNSNGKSAFRHLVGQTKQKIRLDLNPMKVGTQVKNHFASYKNRIGLLNIFASHRADGESQVEQDLFSTSVGGLRDCIDDGNMSPEHQPEQQPEHRNVLGTLNARTFTYDENHGKACLFLTNSHPSSANFDHDMGQYGTCQPAPAEDDSNRILLHNWSPILNTYIHIGDFSAWRSIQKVRYSCLLADVAQSCPLNYTSYLPAWWPSQSEGTS
tara:strand:- start:536 stop:3526 length:2991 start_codon:yes stop_codon:yes gene_type:complete